MAIIQDAITSLMGGDAVDDWQSQLRPCSFRGVPFAIISEEGSHGRRQSVHEYPYRDTAWVEDMGRGTRRFVLKGFLVQDSLSREVYRFVGKSIGQFSANGFSKNRFVFKAASVSGGAVS